MPEDDNNYSELMDTCAELIEEADTYEDEEDDGYYDDVDESNYDPYSGCDVFETDYIE